MKCQDYEKAFSPARLYKYLKAFGGDTVAALTLYRHNIKLCQKFYGVLNIFEVVLRNAINEHYKAYFADQDWIRNQLQPGGMLETHPQKAVVEKTIRDLVKKNRYSNDRLVSSVTFGFWTYLFTKKPFAAGGKTLLQIFPAKPMALDREPFTTNFKPSRIFATASLITRPSALTIPEPRTRNRKGQLRYGSQVREIPRLS